jgi:hypothetical protein
MYMEQCAWNSEQQRAWSSVHGERGVYMEQCALSTLHGAQYTLKQFAWTNGPWNLYMEYVHGSE